MERSGAALERVIVITDIPSPYQVELFDALTTAQVFALRVIYVRAAAPERQWKMTKCAHQHAFLSDHRFTRRDANHWLNWGQLAIFGHYRSALTRRLMRRRAGSAKPWCFWGERPGARYRGALGRWFRRWGLRTLHSQAVPIWGIGQWAVDGYSEEFGRERAYFNVPYFSDLERFSQCTRPLETDGSEPCGPEPCGPESSRMDPAQSGATRWLLYSGSLSHRKGVDLLAHAFAKVALEHPSLGLAVTGAGELENKLKLRLKNLAGQVRFLGFKSWDELPAVYASAQGLIAPSRYDGWGMIIPEALAAGLPVIATRWMGAAIDLLNSSNGWVVTQGDVRAIEDALRSFAALDKTQLQAMASAARQTVASHRLEDGVARFVAAARGTVAQHGLTRCTSLT
ncbi:MAG: glycosyltransferase [Gammaproteobacteria bacterium]|nr:glycosyltransferase [Gammaproteobacteria bacterium]